MTVNDWLGVVFAANALVKHRGRKGVERAAEEFEVITGFEFALDSSYRRFVQFAAGYWDRTFAGADPSDACVTVRISGAESQTVRGSAFLNGPKPSAHSAPHKLPFPRLAR